MDPTIMNVIYSVVVISGLGALFGLGLGFAGKKFAVAEDPSILMIREILPGANCGGCGFVGCDALAQAIASGEAKVNACPVGGAACAEKIAGVLGVQTEDVTPSVAFIKCSGDSSKASYRYDYFGLTDCRAASLLSGGGSKSCKYGCLGMGNCVRACKYGAISYVNGIAVVNKEKCVSCGMCVKACPRKIIELVPADREVRVACNSNDAGKTVRENCSAGCLGCKLCEKACEHGAVHVDGMLSKIDYDKCVMCGECVAKCPTKVIKRYMEETHGAPAQIRT